MSILEHIINSIASRLYNEFNAPVYTSIEDISYPCFFVSLLNNASKEREIGDVFWSEYRISIKYFLSDSDIGDSINELSAYGEQLFDFLELLPLTDSSVLLRGEDIEWNIDDGVLHFFVTYKIRIRKLKDVPKMGSIEEKGAINNA